MKISFTWNRNRFKGFCKSDFENYTSKILSCLDFMQDGFKMLKPVNYLRQDGDSCLCKESGTVIMRADDMPYFVKFDSLAELKEFISKDVMASGYQTLSRFDHGGEVVIEQRNCEYYNPSFAIRIIGGGFQDGQDAVTTFVFDDIK